MPLYEYRCDEDGAVIEVLRPMASADEPVEDPEGKGRVFRRVQSTFAAKGAANGGVNGLGYGQSLPACCPCGKVPGSCQS